MNISKLTSDEVKYIKREIRKKYPNGIPFLDPDSGKYILREKFKITH